MNGKIPNDFSRSPVRPEALEGRTEGFSAESRSWRNSTLTGFKCNPISGPSSSAQRIPPAFREYLSPTLVAYVRILRIIADLTPKQRGELRAMIKAELQARRTI